MGPLPAVASSSHVGSRTVATRRPPAHPPPPTVWLSATAMDRTRGPSCPRPSRGRARLPV
eukprot:scaffold47358_cov66-Phaeocystis_antarctica.AAC.4